VVWEGAGGRDGIGCSGGERMGVASARIEGINREGWESLCLFVSVVFQSGGRNSGVKSLIPILVITMSLS
jgi:hypothetical protein